jgi:phosphatidate cytidylyltransferase
MGDGTPTGSPVSNLLARVLTALVAGPLVIFLTWLGGWPFTILILVAIGISLYEVLSMVERSSPVCGVVTWLLGLALAWGSTTAWFAGHAWFALVGGLMLLLLVHLLFPGPVRGSADRAALSILGILYAGALPACLLHLRALPEGWAWVILVMGITWGSDTSAYFAGKAFGRTKLYPLISPGKTVEGAVGGLAGSVVFALVASWTFFPALSVGHAVVLALLGGVLGQAGDLVESMIKRSVGVKDSGRLLPGHGGMLDRIDALIFATPAVLFYATLVMGWGTA